MNQRDRIKLLFGPYTPAPLKVGDRAFCLYRDCVVIVTSWSDATIPWPRCRAFGTHGGGSGLLVDDELARAICAESAAAVIHWWGINLVTAARWRRAFGVSRASSEGSRRLIRAASQTAAAKMRGRKVSPEGVERRRQTAIAMNLGQHLRHDKRRWTEEELKLLGSELDEVIADRIGKSVSAVRVMRNRLGIPSAFDRRLKRNRS